MHVAVWQNRFTIAWAGDMEQLEVVEMHPQMDVRTALLSKYSTDAHFTPAIVYNGDEILEVSPRLRKMNSVLSTLAENGLSVRFAILAIDVDTETTEEEIARLGDCSLVRPWWYATRGGYRLIWALPRLLNIPEFENLLGRVRSELATIGIVADPLTDWNRCYRLPFVIRDGEEQRHPFEMAGHSPPVLNLEPTEIIEEEIATAILSASPTRIIAPTAEGGRNEFMFKAVASRMRATPWIPEEMYLDILSTFNDNYCDPPLELEELEALVESVKKYEKAEDNREKERVVLRNGGLFEAMNECIDVLAANPGTVYVRDNELVWITNSELGPQVERIHPAALRGLLESKIDFFRYKNTKDGMVESLVDCPRELVDMLEAQSNYPNIQILEELITCPTLTPTGKVLASEGYYGQIKSLLRPSVSVSIEAPNQGDAFSALETLKELLRDFPFGNDHHRSVALAALITPVVRTAIDGPVPMILIDSPTPGSGKSLLADVSSIISTGGSAARMVWTREEEFEKRTTALLASGHRNILIDNVANTLGGPTLDAVLTSDVWMGRELGRTKMMRIRSRAQWLATGNNIQLSGDIQRRVVRCYLDPGMERPEERTGFLHEDLLGYVKRNRGLLVESILTIVAAWLQSGARVDYSAMGSFESWSHVVRGALIWLGEADPVETQKEIRTNDSVGAWGAALTSMWDIWNGDWFTAKELYDDAFNGIRKRGPLEAHESLAAAVEELAVDGEKSSVKQIGWMLKKWSNRVVAGFRLVRSESRHRTKGYQYKVVNVARPDLQVVQQEVDECAS